MPIPWLLAAGAAILGGAIAHNSANNTNERARQISQDAIILYENGKKELVIKQNSAEKNLISLGQKKKDILYFSMQKFINSYSKIKNIKFNSPASLDEISGFMIQDTDIWKCQNKCSIKTQNNKLTVMPPFPYFQKEPYKIPVANRQG